MFGLFEGAPVIVSRLQPGRSGESYGRLRKNPKALAVEAAENSWLPNFSLAI